MVARNNKECILNNLSNNIQGFSHFWIWTDNQQKDKGYPEMNGHVYTFFQKE